VLGTRETVSELDPEAMRAYHQSRYAPNNLTLVAAGAVHFEELVRSARALTADWTPSDVSRTRRLPEPSSESLEMVHPPATQQYTLQYSPGPSYSDEQRYVARVMSSILGDDSGSRLFWELVDTGMAESAATFTQEFEDCGLFCTFLACAPEQHDQNWSAIERILAEGASNPITERELELAKNKICSAMILGSERPSNRLFSIGNAWTVRRKYESIQGATEYYKRVDLASVQKAFESLGERIKVTVSVGPEK
jgi:predicted Zn-dependent peptidase